MTNMEVNRNALLPNLLTIGNGVCGFAALAVLCRLQLDPLEEPGSLRPEQLAMLATASWLILLGMVFDVFDGKVARLVGSASPLGAQLDSLSDMVTFGVAPAFMALRLGSMHATSAVWWQRVVWFFSLAYFLGALLRLARFTAESEPDEGAHLAFKGLPSPGAAGCIASLVLFYTYIMAFQAKELHWLSGFLAPETIQGWVGCIPVGLPILALVLGFAMVAGSVQYDHLGTRVFTKKHTFEFFVYLIFGVILVAVMPEPILPLLFLGYLVHAPIRIAYRLLFAPRAARGRAPDSVDV